ncbi:MAG: FHA domain-containing protein [Kofleriaceae bacterium]
MTAAVRDVGDKVIGLRLWASDTIQNLPSSASAPFLVGTSRECKIRLANRNAAPEHAYAHLTFDSEQWSIRDLGSPYSVHHDGVPSPGFVLTPGLEIGVGGATFVAESERTIRLRAFCRRLLG